MSNVSSQMSNDQSAATRFSRRAVVPEARPAPVLQHGAALLCHYLVHVEGGRFEFDTILNAWDQPHDSN